MIEAGAKIVLGTALYVVVLWVAGRNPRATGMMLTFPTLNGIGLLLAEPALLESATRSMVLMPVVNGIICAGYLMACRNLLLRGWQPNIASAGLLLAMSLVWVAVTAGIAARDWGVGSARQWLYGFCVLCAGLQLTQMRVTQMPGPAFGESTHAPAPSRVAEIVTRNTGRILLFALSLGFVAVFERLGGSGGVLGILASLPLVAFFGLHSLVSDEDRPLDRRIATLDGIAHGVWIGPAIAIFFVAAYWRGLSSLAQWAHGLTYFAYGAGGLLIGWVTAFAVIWLAAIWLHRPQHKETSA